VIPLARSAIAVRSLDSISSCVSKRERAPELVIARLTAAMECESGRLKIAAPSYCPNIQYYDSRLPPADSATSRTTADRSEGLAMNRFADSLVRLNKPGTWPLPPPQYARMRT
jgi:hypothetical protein